VYPLPPSALPLSPVLFYAHIGSEARGTVPPFDGTPLPQHSKEHSARFSGMLPKKAFWTQGLCLPTTIGQTLSNYISVKLHVEYKVVAGVDDKASCLLPSQVPTFFYFSPHYFCRGQLNVAAGPPKGSLVLQAANRGTLYLACSVIALGERIVYFLDGGVQPVAQPPAQGPTPSFRRLCVFIKLRPNALLATPPAGSFSPSKHVYSPNHAKKRGPRRHGRSPLWSVPLSLCSSSAHKRYSNAGLLHRVSPS